MKKLDSILTGSAATTVDSSNTAQAVKSGSLRVFATPAMIALMEEATCNACAPLLDDGETTVGTKINVAHTKASALGATVTAKAELKEVDGRRLVFTVSAHDENGTIGNGEIERFVVDADRFMKRTEGAK